MARTLLLVDDEVDILEPMRVLLEDNYQVMTANSGEEALKILTRETIDMVISDQRMPGMTGVEFLTRVKELYPNIVRIILTGFMDTEATIQAVNDGRVYRYIVKPWNVDEMRVVIKQGLEWKDLLANEGLLNADLMDAHKALAERTKELEKAQDTILKQEKLAAVGRFAAEMVHEMNNHLHIIMGLNSYIAHTLEKELPELTVLEVQVKTLAEIARDIRDFAKGAVSPLAPILTNPVSVAEEVARACMHHPAFRQLDLKLTNENVSAWMIDPKQIQHLLMNLLKNAAKASKPGDRIVLSVSVEEDELVFKVTDQGIGISKDRLAHIFEPFFTTWKSTGTGLGLNICMRTVEAHNGKITVDSTPGKGTIFTVRIPRSEN